MTSSTKYPSTITQTTGGSYRTFSNLSNIKTSSNYAQSSDLIAGKTGTHKRPSTITCTNFKFSLPTGAEITSIQVKYAHQKVSYQGGTPNIPAPSIDLVNVTASAKTGKAPTTSMTENSVTFKVSPAASKVTSSSFGVKINYPANANTNPGYLRVKYVKVIVNYKEPKYTFAVTKNTSKTYKDSTIEVTGVINNKNSTSYNPNVTITLPANVSYESKKGDGTISAKGDTLTWKPGITAKTKSKTITLTIKLNKISNSNTIKFYEPTTKTSKSISFNITETPTIVDDSNITDENIYANNNESSWVKISGPDHTRIYFDMTVTDEDFETAEAANGSKGFRYGRYANPDFSKNTFTSEDTCWNRGSYSFSEFDENNTMQNWWSITNASNSTMIIWSGAEFTSNILFRLDICIYPATLTAPYMVVVHLSNEELARLGDGHVYTVQTFMKEVTSETYLRDWLQNFRIGVFNNPIEENISTVTILNDEGEKETATYDNTDYDLLTDEDFCKHAAYWSKPLTAPNVFENLECEFPYDEDYPIYILICGDYAEASNTAGIQFTEPCIVESDVYKGDEPNGNFPIPIKSTIKSTDDSSELVIPNFETINGVVAYDLPLHELDEDTALIIKGITVSLDVEFSDLISLNVKLRNHNGKTGERSLILDSSIENTITFGGSTDKWGFENSQLRELSKWEIEVTASNLFDNEDNASTIIFNNLQITFHTTTLEEQVVTVLVDGENLAAYGAFLQNVNIPAGLETETKYLNIDGTDTNDAYRQNIKEKIIELEFSVFGCTIYEATQILQDITRLLVNERDELNKPIPKRIEFSHYPGIYWEYVIEDAIETSVEITDYVLKVKLVVPSGTAFTNDEIVTNRTGRVAGLAKVNPRIVFIPLNQHIEITETHSDQKFMMSYNEWGSDCTVEIDCENRSCLLTKPSVVDPIDITAYTDFNSDWFKIFGEFEFEGDNCLIQSVSRIERR